MTSDFTFRVSVDGSTSGSNVLWVHATSKFERDHWVETLGAAIHRLGMRRDLEQAQKTDMMSALGCQMALEEFLKSNVTTYSGFLEKLSMKSHRNWKKRYFELNDQGQLLYFDNEKSKKATHTMQLSYMSVVSSADGERLNGPLVLNTGKLADDAAPGELPDNIAVFDGMDVTVDLETIVADVPENVNLEDLSKMELIAQDVDEDDEVIIERPRADQSDFVVEAPHLRSPAGQSSESGFAQVNVPADFFATPSPTKTVSSPDRKKSCIVM